MTSTTDQRQAAAGKINELIAALKGHGTDTSQLLAECEELARAVAAFHLEGIRFRMFNVDRLLAQAGAGAPSDARTLLEEVRRHLEAAGFHTRSHHAPG